MLVLAGGTDILPRFERGLPLPDQLIDIKHIPALNEIVIHDDWIEIGALTTIQEIHDQPLIRQEFKALHQAAHAFAGPQIRHRGTLGGNICNASPAGDLLPALYAFEAEVILSSKADPQRLRLEKFITGPGQTNLTPGELCLGVRLKRQGYDSHFDKVGLRQSMAISVVNAAFVYQRESEVLTQLRISAGSVAPTVVSLEAFCSASLAAPAELEQHLELIDQAIAPIDDIRATASYRRRVLKNLVRHFLTHSSASF